MPMPSNEEMNFFSGLFLKALAIIGTFLSGVVSTTWIVARKFQGMEDRLKNVEETQASCQGKILVKLDQKLDYIIQEGLPDVHKRIDATLLKRSE